MLTNQTLVKKQRSVAKPDLQSVRLPASPRLPRGVHNKGNNVDNANITDDVIDEIIHTKRSNNMDFGFGKLMDITIDIAMPMLDLANLVGADFQIFFTIEKIILLFPTIFGCDSRPISPNVRPSVQTSQIYTK